MRIPADPASNQNLKKESEPTMETPKRQDQYGRWVTAGLTVRDANFSELPVIDFSAMHGNDETAKAALVEELRKACVNVGFFYLKNHGVPQAVVDRTFVKGKEFFTLPLGDKMTVAKAKTPGYGGYSPLQEITGGRRTGGSLMEGFNMNLDLPANDPFVVSAKPLYNPNSWPAQPEGFRDAMLDYFTAMLDLGKKMFRALALALNLPEDYFLPMIQKPIALMRLNHYPHQAWPKDDLSIGTPAHTDYECFTILCQQGDITALQVQNGREEWVSVPPIPGTFIVNIADQMTRWTNEYFRSSMHRVVNQSGRDRMSIPFFYGTDYDTPISVLDSCMPADGKVKYEPVVAGDYIMSRINGVYGYDLSKKKQAATS